MRPADYHQITSSEVVHITLFSHVLSRKHIKTLEWKIRLHLRSDSAALIDSVAQEQ